MAINGFEEVRTFLLEAGADLMPAMYVIGKQKKLQHIKGLLDLIILLLKHLQECLDAANFSAILGDGR